MPIIIEYVGAKERKTDNVAGTGLVWEGKGDRHKVSEKDAAMLLRHPDVWAEVPGDGAGEGAGLADKDDTSAITLESLDAMELQTLKSVAKQLEIAVGNSGRDRVIALIAEKLGLKAPE